MLYLSSVTPILSGRLRTFVPTFVERRPTQRFSQGHHNARSSRTEQVAYQRVPRSTAWLVEFKPALGLQKSFGSWLINTVNAIPFM